MLKFLIKLFAVFVFLIPLFFFVGKGSDPQPAYAVDNCVLRITTPAAALGQNVTTTMTGLSIFDKYKVELVWTDLFAIQTQTWTKTSPLTWDNNVGIVFNWDGGTYFTRAGFYYFWGYKTSGLRSEINELCRENPPQFMLSAPAGIPECRDGKDNDGDGGIDFGSSVFNDPDCTSPDDPLERGPAPPPLVGKCTVSPTGVRPGKTIIHVEAREMTGGSQLQVHAVAIPSTGPSPPGPNTYIFLGTISFSDGSGAGDFLIPEQINTQYEYQVMFESGVICTPDLAIIPPPPPPVPGKNPCDPNCQTALGTIKPTLGQFAVKIIKIVFGLAGGIALILMVIGAIRVLTSSGDQQKLSGGREMITAALIGLLFLIFSVLILQFILENLFGFKVNPTLI